MPTVIESDGSSTEITGSGRGSSGSARVSPIITSGMPATAISSPRPALRLDAVEGLADEQLGDLHASDRPVSSTPRNSSCGELPLLHTTEREPADVGRGVEVGDERLQRMTLS